MTQKFRKLFAWLQKNERHISAPMFVAGFITDLFTVVPLSIEIAVQLYGLYLIISAGATIGAHYLFVRDGERDSGDETDEQIAKQPKRTWFLRAMRVVLSLAAQFTTGGLLSGCLIFYTRSAALGASWPFVLLLIVIFIGNEALRMYREKLAFRGILFFFSLYAYTIFALPTLLHTISPQTFLESTAVSIGIFVAYLIALALVGWTRLKASLWKMSLGIVGVIVVVNISYFSGIIPPLPLSLSDVGVYHSITHDSQGYEVQAEAQTQHVWWDIGNWAVGNFTPITVTIVPGDSLSVFSSVFAPTFFSTAIVHHWEWYNPATHTWEMKAEIAFGISGGRDDGYRGYSTLSNLTAGKYRVSIQTLSGQVIGRILFTIQTAPAEPVLHTEIH